MICMVCGHEISPDGKCRFCEEIISDHKPTEWDKPAPKSVNEATPHRYRTKDGEHVYVGTVLRVGQDTRTLTVSEVNVNFGKHVFCKESGSYCWTVQSNMHVVSQPLGAPQ